MKRIIALFIFFFFTATVSTSFEAGASEKKVAKSATQKHKDKKDGCDMKSGGDTKKDDCCKMESVKESKKEAKEESKKDSDKK